MRSDSAEGILLVDKAEGLTSFRVVEVVRQLLGGGKVGHGGTLDPFATGLLPVLVGRGVTRQASRFLGGDKEYRMTLRFGCETDTGDWRGRVVGDPRAPWPSREQVQQVLGRFVGEVVQEAPAFSALKHDGRPLYWYARRGIAVQKPPLRVRIVRLDLLEYLPPDAVFAVTCGHGAYMRVLGRDLARAAGSRGHLVALRRLRVGAFRVEDAVPWWKVVAGGVAVVLANLRPGDAG